jgi:hypothetical protein
MVGGKRQNVQTVSDMLAKRALSATVFLQLGSLLWLRASRTISWQRSTRVRVTFGLIIQLELFNGPVHSGRLPGIVRVYHDDLHAGTTGRSGVARASGRPIGGQA